MYSFRLCCGVEDIVVVGVVKEGLSCACVRGVPNAAAAADERRGGEGARALGRRTSVRRRAARR